MINAMDEAIDGIYREIAAKQPGNPMLFGRKIYSQCDEDGIIRHILDTISTRHPLSKTFVEFGAGSGLENNTHALLLEGFTGCWIEGAEHNIRYIEEELGALRFPRLQVHGRMVARANISGIIADCVEFLRTDEMDFLSMDLDGNDYHFMRVIMETVRPKLVCVEYNHKFPPPMSMIMEYNESHVWAGNDYYGASLQAWADLLTGYALVSCNVTGVNAFFVRNDLCSPFPVYPVEEVYQPCRFYLAERHSGHAPSLGWLRQNLY